MYVPFSIAAVCSKIGYFHNLSGIGRLQSASVKDRSLRIADAIPSSRSLTSAAFRSADPRDEIMKVAVKSARQSCSLFFYSP